jgi:3'-5' exonuclease
MQQLVIDIETSGAVFEDLPEATQTYLTKRADTPEKIEEVKERLNLYPLTGEVVAIGVLDVETATGAVYFQAPNASIEPFEDRGVRFVPGTEKECLEHFWEDVVKVTRIITFSGRMFDCPWLMLRSLVHGVSAQRNLMPPRYQTGFHVDLAEQLSFYGATRNYSLDFWCQTLGITSPKHDISGAEVPAAYRAGEYERIARYNADDIRATRELFVKWDHALSRA